MFTVHLNMKKQILVWKYVCVFHLCKVFGSIWESVIHLKISVEGAANTR
jgi:hypothetical protein